MESNVYDNLNTLDDKVLLILLRLLDSYEGELRFLGNLMKLVGKDSTMQMMKYFKGETVTFPSAKVVDEKLNELICFIYYKVLGYSWDESLTKVYGDNIEPHQRKHLRNSIRDINLRLKKISLDTNDINKIYNSDEEGEYKYDNSNNIEG